MKGLAARWCPDWRKVARLVVILFGKRGCRAAAVALLLAEASLPSPSLAGPLLDPTRPPDSLAAGREAKEGDQAAASEEARLRAVLVTPRRRLAAVDGQWVAEGEEVAGGTVARVSWGEVVLRSGSDETPLKLAPLAAPIRIAVARQPLVAPVALPGKREAGTAASALSLSSSTAK